eukprot:TRINITY_DN25162_c0_g1_i1.p1 TRINITY_DN25162_c0_g1~~TRINITY_DN25162_c0_g1_i1.p1  ORF type:complete len:124 (-),score=39.33 TRINITY_DN25162_c0_g1_i1:9-380(-)
MAPSKDTIEKAFANADTDDNGKLSLNEFKAVMIELAEDEEEREQCKNEGFLEMLMIVADGDGDKMLTCDELLKLIDENELNAAAMLTKFINGADKDGDGFLTAAELKAMLIEMDQKEKILICG